METLNVLRPHPLPRNNYNPFTQTPLHDAYEECLKMETSAGTVADEDALVFPRCLGYLILELPHEAGVVIAHEIIECRSNFERMKSLSRFYIDHLIRLCEPSFTLDSQLPLNLLSSSTEQGAYPCFIGAL